LAKIAMQKYFAFRRDDLCDVMLATIAGGFRRKRARRTNKMPRVSSKINWGLTNHTFYASGFFSWSHQYLKFEMVVVDEKEEYIDDTGAVKLRRRDIFCVNSVPDFLALITKVNKKLLKFNRSATTVYIYSLQH
jgi:hypothetical protein